MDKYIDDLCANKWSILVKRYYRNPSEYNKEKLLNQANECTKLFIEQNKTISSKLDCPDTASKTCWSIINRFLNKEEILLVNRKLVSDFDKKA